MVITYREEIYSDLIFGPHHIPAFAMKLLVRIWTNGKDQWTHHFTFRDDQMDQPEKVRDYVLIKSRKTAWSCYWKEMHATAA